MPLNLGAATPAYNDLEPYGPEHLADIVPFPAPDDSAELSDDSPVTELAFNPSDTYANSLETERRPSVQGQLLFESDYLRANRLPDGSFHPVAVAEVRQNHKTALGEAEVQSLIMKSIHQLNEATDCFEGFGKSTIQIAKEGRDRIRLNNEQSKEERQAFEDEYERSDIEVDDELDAHQNRAQLRAGKVKVFVSPPPTPEEMDQTIAEKEFGYDRRTILRKRTVLPDSREQTVEAISIFGVPPDVWGKVLAKRGIKVPSNPNAKDIMQTHTQNYFEPSDADLLELAVKAAYELEGQERAEVLREVAEIRDNQAALQQGAEYYVDEWLDHTKELANSRDGLVATSKVKQFIDTFYDGQDSLLSADLRLLVDSHRLPNGEYRMSKDLAELVEVMKRNTLWIRASAKLGNKKTLEKLDQSVAKTIVANETRLQSTEYSTYDSVQLQNATSYLVAQQNLAAGGGCAGGTCDLFGGSTLSPDGTVTSISTPNSVPTRLEEGEYVNCPDCGKGQILRKQKLDDGKTYFTCRYCPKKVAA